MMVIWGIILAWVACGIIAAGFSFAYLQGRWASIADDDYASDLRFSLWTGIYGPFALLEVWMGRTYVHGWRLW